MRTWGPSQAIDAEIERLALHIVKPGEETAPLARNSTQVDMASAAGGLGALVEARPAGG